MALRRQTVQKTIVPNHLKTRCSVTDYITITYQWAENVDSSKRLVGRVIKHGCAGRFPREGGMRRPRASTAAWGLFALPGKRLHGLGERFIATKRKKVIYHSRVFSGGLRTSSGILVLGRKTPRYRWYHFHFFFSAFINFLIRFSRTWATAS